VTFCGHFFSETDLKATTARQAGRLVQTKAGKENCIRACRATAAFYERHAIPLVERGYIGVRRTRLHQKRIPVTGSGGVPPPGRRGTSPLHDDHPACGMKGTPKGLQAVSPAVASHRATLGKTRMSNPLQSLHNPERVEAIWSDGVPPECRRFQHPHRIHFLAFVSFAFFAGVQPAGSGLATSSGTGSA
jgi:hypothetical protein